MGDNIIKMEDNINDLPTDEYPISIREKQIVEKFFSHLQEEETNEYNQYKLPAIIIILCIFVNLPFVDNILSNLFENDNIKINILKVLFIILIVYFINKNEYIKSLIY